MTTPAGQPMSFRFAAPCPACRFIVVMTTPAGWACSLCGLERIEPQTCTCSLPDQSCQECRAAAARNEAYLKGGDYSQAK